MEFLDVTTSICDGHLKTVLYIKPTDSTRYLNRRSYHSAHTFSGMPYSQYKRAAVIFSDFDDRKAAIQRMDEKFVRSGHKREQVARDKALSLNREDLLKLPSRGTDNSTKVLACVINQDPELRKELGSFFKSHEKDVKKLLGDVKIVVSERRHANISSILFQKAGFSQILVPIKENSEV